MPVLLKKSLTLRAMMLALVYGAACYVAIIAGIIAYKIAPTAAAIRQQSEKLSVEFEASRERAAALKFTIDEARDLLRRSQSYGAQDAQPLRMKAQEQVDSARSVERLSALSGIPGDMRLCLGRAATVESQLGAALIESLAEIELGNYANADSRLKDCETLNDAMQGHLSEAQRAGLTDIIAREKAMGLAADAALRAVGWWATIGVLIAPLLVLLVQKRFYRPLAELDGGLARIAGGDLGTTIEVRHEDELGRLGFHFNRMTDVLRQRADEERRREQNLAQRLGRILDESSNEIYIFDAETLRFAQVNRGARENLGYTQEDFFRLTPLDLLPEFGDDSFDRLVRPLRDGERQQAMIATVQRRKDGTVYPVEINLQISRQETPAVFVAIVQDITERREMEEALRESESQFRALTETSSAGIFIYSGTRYVYANPAGEQITGYTMDELVSKNTWDIFHPDYQELIRQRTLARQRCEEVPVSCETKIITRNGEERWLEVSGRSISYQSQPAVLVTAFDVTKRKRAEEALRLSEEKFSRAFRSGPNSMMISSLEDGRYIDVNDTFLSLTGYARAEVIGRTSLELNVWEKAEDRDALIRELAEKGGVSNFETGYRKKNGEIGYVLLSAETIEIEGERCLLAVSADITERKRIEEALRASEQRFYKAFHASPTSMSILSLRDGRFIDVNQTFLRLTGNTRQEVIGRTAADINIWANPQERKEVTRMLFEQGSVSDLEIEFLGKDGHRGTHVFSAEVVELDSEQCVICATSDITWRKQAEQSLRESEHLFRTLAETAAVGIYIYQGDRCVYLNPTAQATGGYTMEEMLGMKVGEAVHPDFQETVRERAAARQRGETPPSRYELKIIAKSGQERWLDVMTAVINYQGAPAVLVTSFDITERREMEEALRESQQLLSSITRNITEGIYRSTPDRGLIYVNEAFVKMFGYDSAQEMLKIPSAAMYDNPQRREELRKVIEQRGRFVDQEIKFKRKDGSFFWGLNSSIAIHDDEGRVLYYDGAIWDITERRKMEEALRESESLFRTLAETAAVGIYIYRGTRFIYVNSTAGVITGYSIQELLSMNVWDVFHPDVRDLVRERALARQRGEEVPSTYEARLVGKNGEEKWVHITARVITYQGERAVLITAFDITERRRAEEALRESEAMFRTLAEAVAVGIYIYREGRLVYANPAAEAIGGYSKEELLSLDPWESVHPDYRDEIKRRNIARLKGDLSPSRYEMKILTKAGEERWVDVTTAVINYQRQSSVLATSFDITERKRAEEALRESQRFAQQITDLIPDVVYVYDIEEQRNVYANRNIGLSLGYTQEEIESLGAGFMPQAMHTDDWPLFLDQLNFVSSLGDGEILGFEYRMRHKDGEWRWFHSRDTVFSRLSDGSVKQIIGTATDITERKRAEDALRESEERFFKAFNASPMSMGINRLTDGAYIDVNEAALRESGFSREELLGKTPEELGIWMTTEDRRRMALVMRKEGRIRDFEVRHRRRSGEERISLMSAEIIETAGQKCLLTTAFDITERKRAEDALRESEERFSKAFQASPLTMTIAALDDGCIIAANESFLRATGFRREEVVGRTATELGLWADPQEREDFMRRVIEQGEARDVEMVNRTKSGEERTGLLSGVVIELGGEQCVLFTGSDITERKRAERALRESEKRFRALIENSFDVIIMFDASGKILYTSPSVTRVLGYYPEELVGRIGIDLLHPQEMKRSAKIFDRITRNPRSVVEVTNKLLHRNGSYRTLQVIGTNLLDEPGVEAVVSNLRDITDRVEAEEEVRRLNEELEHRVVERTAQLQAVNRELEAFSYSVSHDLRAPLRSIDGFSLALLEDCGHQVDETGRDYLNRVRAASQRMGHLIDDLLNLSRITRSDMHRERIDLSALARTIVEEMRATGPLREVEISIEPGLFVEGDPRLLRVALENLLGNAWKFTGRQERASIEFGSARNEGETIFYVRDNGAGFDMNYSDKLFGAFQRLHSMNEFKGTGIGLATVQRIIHRHGGRIWADGAVDRGATFYFTL